MILARPLSTFQDQGRLSLASQHTAACQHRDAFQYRSTWRGLYNYAGCISMCSRRASFTCSFIASASHGRYANATWPNSARSTRGMINAFHSAVGRRHLQPTHASVAARSRAARGIR